MAKRILVGLGVALAFGIAACGGSDGGGNALDDAVTAALKESAAGSDSPVEIDDAMIGCVDHRFLGFEKPRYLRKVRVIFFEIPFQSPMKCAAPLCFFTSPIRFLF